MPRNSKPLLPIESPIVQVKHKWTLQEGLTFLRMLYVVAFEQGYNLHLGGSLMYQGYSAKDLDVVAIRRPQVRLEDVGIAQVLDRALTYQFTCIQKNTAIPDRLIYKLFNRNTEQHVDLIVLDQVAHPEVVWHSGSEAIDEQKVIELKDRIAKAWDAESTVNLPTLQRWIQPKEYR